MPGWNQSTAANRILIVPSGGEITVTLLSDLIPEVWPVWEHWRENLRRSIPCLPGCRICPDPVRWRGYCPAEFQCAVRLPDSEYARTGKIYGPLETRLTVVQFSEANANSLDGYDLCGLSIKISRGRGKTDATRCEPLPQMKVDNLPPVFNWRAVLMRFWGLREWPKFAETEERPDVLPFRKLG